MTRGQPGSWLRFAMVAGLLLGAVIFLHARSRAEVVPAHKALAEFPTQLGEWIGHDQPIPASYLAVLGPGDFLTRIYSHLNSQVPPISLYIAYFPSQRTGDTIHSPKNCLPGAGWAPLSSERIPLKLRNGPPIIVNRYILTNGGQRLLVLYWYQAHGRAVPSEYTAKIYLVADAMRMNRTDGALVRVLTPVQGDPESVAAAERRMVDFTNLLLPSLDEYIPR